jgi:hypothetical protein
MRNAYLLLQSEFEHCLGAGIQFHALKIPFVKSLEIAAFAVPYRCPISPTNLPR